MAELHMDEKWKLSKKGSRNNGSRKVSIAETNTIGSSNGNGNGNQYLKRSESAREARSCSRSNPRSFSSRCANLVKEQRAKFYIMRRCVTMLVCWKDYA